jgi:hypothetical protein
MIQHSLHAAGWCRVNGACDLTMRLGGN